MKKRIAIFGVLLLGAGLVCLGAWAVGYSDLIAKATPLKDKCVKDKDVKACKEAIGFYQDALKLAAKEEEKDRIKGRIKECKKIIPKKPKKITETKTSEPSYYEPSPPVAPVSTTTTTTSKTGWKKITAGKFLMGSPESEGGRDSDETQHWVTLTIDFSMMKYEVTQGEFQNLMGYNPSNFSSCGSSCPVETVSWHEALAYANALSKKDGLTPCYSCSGSGKDVTCSLKSNYSRPQDCPGYRLPTEAEWEYAARAGTTTAFYNGGITVTDWNCNSDPNLSKIGWYCGNAGKTTHSVGQKQANDWGLYDMSGNVWEWVWDWYGDYPGSVTDPAGLSSGSSRVDRGGGWFSLAQDCRSAIRDRIAPGYRNFILGFRLARSL